MREDVKQLLAESEAKGAALAERWSQMPGKALRGYSAHKVVDFLEGIPKEDRQTRAMMAILFENTLNWIRGMEESTRMVQVGSFEKFVFPILRAVYANLVAADLVTVQPLTAPTGLVFYFDVVYGTTKGRIQRGQKMYDVRTGPSTDYHYSDEVVEEEAVGAAGAAQYGGGTTALAWTPVRAGTLRFTDGTLVVTDDGNGALVGDIGVGVNTINYSTGVFDVTFSGVTTGAVTASYEYDSEMHTSVPEVDLVLTSAPVTARSQKLRARWSVEGQQDLKAYHGIDAEVELVGFMANEIAKELNYKVVRHISQVAAAGNVTWSRTPGAGVPWIWHKEALYDAFVQASNLIFQRTQRRSASWLLAGTGVCNVIETLSKFKSVGAATGDTAGVRKIGTIGDFGVYKDPTYSADDFLMGYKGNTFLDAGYILAPYLGLYTTPTIVLDDFFNRKGMAQRTGLKVVNANFYVTGQVTA
jgi:hypothetical protein